MSEFDRRPWMRTKLMTTLMRLGVIKMYLKKGYYRRQ
jgi:hypothetical protein